MANPKLTVEFLPSGGSDVKFSSITGVTPGKLDRAGLQARKELRRLCGLAGVEARRQAAEREQEKLEAETAEVAALEVEEEEDDDLDEEEEIVVEEETPVS